MEYELKIYKREKDMLAPEELKKVHPLGKAPVIGVQGPNMTQPKIIAESGNIVEYLIDHFGKPMIPTRYPAGQEDEVGGETEEWLRYRYYMHYAEGSLMPLLVIALFMGGEFSLCPVTSDARAAVAELERRNQERLCALLHQANHQRYR